MNTRRRIIASTESPAKTAIEVECPLLLLEDKTITGVRVSQNDDQIVLRNLAQPNPITIAVDEIEEVIKAKVSLMPANLVRLLKDAQEFDHLMRYILQVRKRCPDLRKSGGLKPPLCYLKPSLERRCGVKLSCFQCVGIGSRAADELLHVFLRAGKPQTSSEHGGIFQLAFHCFACFNKCYCAGAVVHWEIQFRVRFELFRLSCVLEVQRFAVVLQLELRSARDQAATFLHRWKTESFKRWKLVNHRTSLLLLL